MANKLFVTNSYNKIRIDIRTMMDEQGISRNALAKSIGARFEVIDKWYSGYVERIDSDILARICYVLECTPGDIIKIDDSIS